LNKNKFKNITKKTPEKIFCVMLYQFFCYVKNCNKNSVILIFDNHLIVNNNIVYTELCTKSLAVLKWKVNKEILLTELEQINTKYIYFSDNLAHLTIFSKYYRTIIHIKSNFKNK
jgi:hypothetical protein